MSEVQTRLSAVEGARAKDSDTLRAAVSSTLAEMQREVLALVAADKRNINEKMSYAKTLGKVADKVTDDALVVLEWGHKFGSNLTAKVAELEEPLHDSAFKIQKEQARELQAQLQTQTDNIDKKMVLANKDATDAINEIYRSVPQKVEPTLKPTT